MNHSNSGAVYRVRPSWRPRWLPDVLVPASLNMLCGEAEEVVCPPTHLWWQPKTIDLNYREDAAAFYSSALPNYAGGDERWVNKNLLKQAWSELSLPQHVRGAWETLHPDLCVGGNIMDDYSQHWMDIQNTVLATIDRYGFALAGGSALKDYDIISRETYDVDTFNDKWDITLFDQAVDAIIQACEKRGWSCRVVENENMRRHISIDDDFLTVSLVYYGRSCNPEVRAEGGLRLMFTDVVGGKAAAIADAPRERDFHDLASILATDGWDMGRVEEALCELNRGEQLDAFRANVARFREGKFDDSIRAAGFDAGWCHDIIG